MAKHTKPYYVNSYLLTTFIQTLQSMPKKYDPRDYFGSCMRMQEDQIASFLYDFINDIAVILPEHLDLMASLIFVSRSSGYKPIKKLLPAIINKYNYIESMMHKRQNAAERVKPILDGNAGRFNILENKKKMLMMSCSDICALGDAINAEKNFNTTRIKNKFFAFVTYRIELVLSGKMIIDPDFKVLLNKYGTSRQIHLYDQIISNRLSSYTPVQMPPVSKMQTTVQPKQKLQPKPAAKPKTRPVTRPVAQQKQQPSQPKQKKSGMGFFKKIGQSVKKVFNKVKKPLLVGGIFALSIFGGKRAYDAVVEESNGYTQTESYTNNITPVKKAPVLNLSDSLRTNNQQTVRKNDKTTAAPVANDVMKKTVNQLHNLKANNPIDRNMDVTGTANRLYQKFGNDAYKVVLASAMTPYALNEYTKFDLRPSTHNMIEYLCNHELTTAQRNALDVFIARHVKNNSINMNDFAAYSVNQLMQNQR